MQKLMVVDDEPSICFSFRRVFERDDIKVLTAGTLADGIAAFHREHPDVVVMDLQLPDGSGIELFDQIRKVDPRRPVIFITAHGTTDTAIEAMKNGAFDYLIKPVDLSSMSELLERAFDASRMMHVPAALPTDKVSDRIIGRTLVMQEMSKTIGRFASLDVNVLIEGESGTGKELVARAIYQHSHRSNKPFLPINCAALPESLVESELFGHEQGAFTGASRQRIGKFEQCDGGTILLDEIGDMPLPIQAKMLRILQEQKFERLGGNNSLSTDVRIIAATNQSMEQLVAQGRFRNDLYYRLKGATIRVPPLRERKGDIHELAHHFLYEFNQKLNLDIESFSAEVMDAFKQHSWPGNVRELQGVIKESMVRAVGRQILPEYLPPGFWAAPSFNSVPNAQVEVATLTATIDRLLGDGLNNVHQRLTRIVERELFIHALRFTKGHQSKASDVLGINRTTLRTKLRELGITLDRIVTGSEADDDNSIENKPESI